MGITKERVSLENGQIHYRALIRSLRDKMRNWNPGRLVRLKTVNVDGVPLKLQIYPNGYTWDTPAYISYFIENLGSCDIELDFELRIKGVTLEETDFPILSNQKGGGATFFDDDKLLVCRGYDRDLNSDEALEIHWIIKKVWKDVDSFNNNAKLSASLKKIETEINKDRKKIPLPECPICSNDMGPGVKIAQCLSGHLLCWTCKERMSAPQCITQCPSCQAPVVNRAHGMESYIKTLLQ